MQKVVSVVQRVAESGAATVLLLGESGVGKGIIARALHNAHAADAEPFMNISCTSLPDQLLESELFGHERGAFTDAHKLKRGRFELASSGTLFLEIFANQSISTAVQALMGSDGYVSFRRRTMST